MSAILAAIIKLILDALLPLILARAQDTAEDGAGFDESDAALAARIKEDGW